MAANSAERSVLGTGLRHFALSVVAFGTVGAAAAGGAYMFGNEEASGPQVELALFAIKDGPPPELKTRIGADGANQIANHGAEPSLPGIEYLEEDGAQSASFKVIEVSEGEIDAGEAHVAPLARAPLSGFHERTSAGSLPKIAADGRTPAQAYARPFADKTGAPKISLVVAGLGLKDRHTMAAIRELPPEVTLAFSPYEPKLQYYLDLAREAGHEVLIELPMEAYDYPNVDTGPQTLLTGKASANNLRRLEAVLGKAEGYFGLTNYQGAKFATDVDAAAPVFEAMQKRGLAFLHDGAAARSVLPQTAKELQLDFRVADRIVDTEPTADAIDRELLQLEALAIQNGHAVGVGYAYPVTIEQFRNWSQGLKAKGYQLAPVSAAMNIQADPTGSPTH